MLRFLLKPHPCNVEPKNMLGQSLAVSVFIFLFLFIFQPFEISSKPDEHVLNLSIMYSLITLVCSLIITLGIPFLFPSIFEDFRWNVLKEILFICLIVLVISCVNFYCSIYYYLEYQLELSAHLMNSSFPPLLRAMLYTFSIAIIPCIMLVMFNQFRLLNRSVKGSQLINDSLHSKTVVGNVTDVFLHGEGKNEQLQFKMEDFLFARASANYSEIFCMSNNEVTKSLLRSSMNSIEDQLVDFDVVERVHRGYLVNLNNVINVTGNAQGYRLHFKNAEEFVPVSRQKSKVVKSKLVA